jgi:hypothetical protein
LGLDEYKLIEEQSKRRSSERHEDILKYEAEVPGYEHLTKSKGWVEKWSKVSALSSLDNVIVNLLFNLWVKSCDQGASGHQSGSDVC